MGAASVSGAGDVSGATASCAAAGAAASSQARTIACADQYENVPQNAERLCGALHLLPRPAPENSCVSAVPIAEDVSCGENGLNHCMAPQLGSCLISLLTLKRQRVVGAHLDMRVGTFESHRRAIHPHDVGDEPASQLACQLHQRIPLRGCGSLVHGQNRAHGLRGLATHLAHSKVAIAGDRCGHRQSVEATRLVGSARDAPCHHGLTPGGLGFAVHDAAAGKDLGGPRFDVFANDATMVASQRS